MNDGKTAAPTRYTRHLSPLAVWALSFGCSVGWGAFVMPGTTFLPIAGPLGTVIGILIGALVMFVIGVNYNFLMNRYPDSGGIFTFTKKAFGYDHAFLSSWSIGLVYLAIIWANCTALPLIFRTVFGDLLEFGYLYTIAGYEVYLGEVLLSLASLALIGLLCLRGGKIASSAQILMALLLALGVGAVLIFLLSSPAHRETLSAGPAFSPEYMPAVGTMVIVFLAPWAFAGFESVSQSVEEFKFPVKKSLTIMTAALVTAAAAYAILALAGASALPEGAKDWVEYTGSLKGRSGVEGVPVFYGVLTSGGKAGLAVLGVAAAAGILTGLLGNTFAASRLIQALARDDLLGEKMGRLNRFGVPSRAVIFLLLVSLPIPFLGRSAIGWVVDINTVGVTIAYAYTSAAALKEAFRSHKRSVQVTGGLGLFVSLFFLVFFLIPAGPGVTKFSTQSYLILLVWILVGFLAFYLVFRRDQNRRIGRSTVVWIVLLLLLFSTSFIWMKQTADSAASKAAEEWALSEKETDGLTAEDREAKQESLNKAVSGATDTVVRNNILLYAVIVVSLLIIFRIYSNVRKSRETAVEDRTAAVESSNAKTTFLSNMSHDIRTPMNAIIGYVTLARREKGLSPKVEEYLGKIASSSDHLLALINDVLEMSRIESGKMELAPVPSDLGQILEDLRSLFSTQMDTKGLTFTVTYDGVPDTRVLCDANRLNRVLLNLVSNAYKFTPSGGSVTVTLTQRGRQEDKGLYTLSVKDTGMGMSPEFAAKVFEAYERERTSAVENIQGTGLGTAITKSIVDLMGGTIRVETEQGKGSEFIIDVAFPLDPEAVRKNGSAAAADPGATFAGMRLLLAEDDPDNRTVAQALFGDLGFTVDTVENGEDAVEALAASPAGKYAAVVLDIEMPVKNGYDAARLIRSLKNSQLAGVPIVAMTAKAFSEDIAAARAAGMNAHVPKPVDPAVLKKTMTELLLRKDPEDRP